MINCQLSVRVILLMWWFCPAYLRLLINKAVSRSRLNTTTRPILHQVTKAKENWIH